MVDRRTLLMGIMGVLATSARGKSPATVTFGGASLARELRLIEAASGGRLGVAILDTATGRGFAHRGAERFAMCSTFKLLLAAAILHRVDRGTETLDRPLPIAATDIIAHSPVTEPNVGRNLSIAELCHATVTQSDNAAANLLLPAAGGPAGLTRYFRSLGDNISRSDRTEPSMNDVVPPDPRDTTTPNAMLANLHRLLIGDALSTTSRAQLTRWIVANRTGDTRLRAGLPKGWTVGDKTGSGPRGETNDIAILWPPRRKPILITTYLGATEVPPERRNAALAAVARAVAREIAN